MSPTFKSIAGSFIKLLGLIKKRVQIKTKRFSHVADCTLGVNYNFIDNNSIIYVLFCRSSFNLYLYKIFNFETIFSPTGDISNILF